MYRNLRRRISQVHERLFLVREGPAPWTTTNKCFRPDADACGVASDFLKADSAIDARVEPVLSIYELTCAILKVDGRAALRTPAGTLGRRAGNRI